MKLVDFEPKIEIESHTSDGGRIILSRGNSGEIQIVMKQRGDVKRNDVRVNELELLKAVKILIGYTKLDLDGVE
jgi:hypothetical protein